jgi:hypothetical protein
MVHYISPLSSMKKNNISQYHEIRDSCKNHAREMVVCMGDIGEDDIEIHAHAYAQQVISIFDDPIDEKMNIEFDQYVYKPSEHI